MPEKWLKSDWNEQQWLRLGWNEEHWITLASRGRASLSGWGLSPAGLEQILAGQPVTNPADRERLARLLVAAFSDVRVSRLAR